MHKPDDWPEGFKRTKLEILIDVDGVLTPVEPDDLRLLELKEVMIRESWVRVPPGSEEK